MSYPIVTLQKGKEANAVYRHPWIFSGALVKRPSEETVAHGSMVRVADGAGRVLGTGSYSAKSSIAVRLFTFSEAEVTIDAAWFAVKFREAESRRALLGYGPETPTTGYRLIFGEADGVPGLVVDRYADVLVLQSSTAAMDALRDDVVKALVEVFAPRAIVERSDLQVRKEEALHEQVGVLFGEDPGIVAFTENGVAFEANVTTGQKTGFFLDQKSLRAAIARYSKDRKVLNLFSYTGAAGVSAIKGGAKEITNVDSSADALAGCLRHAEMNDIAPEHFLTVESDAFQFLTAAAEKKEQYDMVLLDPPALIKSQRDTDEGKKAYHFLNRGGLRLVADGGIFVTSSCSHFMSEDDLAFTLRRASVQSNVTIDVLEVVRQAPDHPVSVYFPESAYLKSFVCRVRRNAEAPTRAVKF